METTNHLHAAARRICRTVWPQSNDPTALKGLKITALAITTLALLYAAHVAYTVSVGKAAPQFLLSLVPVVISAVADHCLSKEKANTKLGVLPQIPTDENQARLFFANFAPRVVPHENKVWSVFIEHRWGTQLSVLNWKTTFVEPHCIMIKDDKGQPVVKLNFKPENGNYLISKITSEQSDNKES